MAFFVNEDLDGDSALKPRLQGFRRILRLNRLDRNRWLHRRRHANRGAAAGRFELLRAVKRSGRRQLSHLLLDGPNRFVQLPAFLVSAQLLI
jgi:hypothetical protein